MTPRDLPRNAVLAAGNLLRSLRRKGLDCVVLPIRGSYPERTARRDPLPFPFNRLSLFPTEVSLEIMAAAFEAIRDEQRVKSVVLRFGPLHTRPSALYSLRRMLSGLRASGKHVVAWLPTTQTWDYYLASACDEIILPPPGQLAALGLRAEAIFLKDTLALAGVKAELEAIGEYKTSPDTFCRSTMSEPHREMLDSILDAYFDEIVAAIAEGRGLDPARVRELIDAMPLTASEAAEVGLIDAVLYEDELATHLSAAGRGPDKNEQHKTDSAPPPRPSVTLLPWRDASRWLRRPIKWTTRQIIGVVSLEGLIVPGRSRRIPIAIPLPLPLVERQAGAETITQALRRAELDERVAAVIFHVETSGGSALASELICREVRRLRERKPVIVLMGNQAASGGYQVSALANHIVARPTTLTGSIGIWGGKFVIADLYHKLEVGHESVQRGVMAGFPSELSLLSDVERRRLRSDLGQAYARFKTLVAEGRGLAEEQVEEIARGQVHTGARALELGLVDELGGFETALAAAKKLAGLKPEQEYTVVQIRPPRHSLPPPPFQQTGNEGLRAMLNVLRDLARERVWALAPWLVRIR
jgi:protease-4